MLGAYILSSLLSFDIHEERIDDAWINEIEHELCSIIEKEKEETEERIHDALCLVVGYIGIIVITILTVFWLL